MLPFLAGNKALSLHKVLEVIRLAIRRWSSFARIAGFTDNLWLCFALAKFRLFLPQGKSLQCIVPAQKGLFAQLLQITGLFQ